MTQIDRLARELSAQAAWPARYAALVAALPTLVGAARLTLCGLNACIDARMSLHDLGAALATSEVKARDLMTALLARVRDGVGGEISVDWPGGPAWLAARAPIGTALGGTGPHAASVLSRLGAPALLCLGDRSTFMLSHVPADILLAEGGDLLPAVRVAPRGERRPEIFIFEYVAGHAVGPVTPSRSSRIIVRFHNPVLEDDPDFMAQAPRLAATAGAGLVSGFNAVPAAALDRELGWAVPLAQSWREAGLGTVHLELAGYDGRELVERVLDAFAGVVTSIGMSQSELAGLEGPADDPRDAMLRLAARTGVRRVAVHADHWAAAVTRGDPDREWLALMAGCLVAGARAAAGMPVRPAGIDAAARFHPLPFPERTRYGDWTAVGCASPYLERPATTLGLGDTFTAGCLLVLGAGSVGQG